MSTTAAAVTTLAAVLGVPVIWCHGYWTRGRITARVAAARAERAARPVDRRPAIEDTVSLELALACCERWWTSCGAEHDTTNCTRKDQTL